MSGIRNGYDGSGRRRVGLRVMAAMIGLAVAGATPAAAQETSPAQDTAVAQAPATRVTFDDAIAIALRQSSSLERARNQVELSGLGVTDAAMQFVPDIRLSAGGDQDFGRTFSTDEGQILDGNNHGVSARLSSSVTLFDGLGNVASLKQAQLQATAAELDAERAEQTVVFSVISGFIGMIEAGEQVRVAEENLAFQEARQEEVRALVDGGRQPIADLYQQQAQVASARASLVEARRAAALSEVDLVQALRLDPTGRYEFVAPPVPDSVSLRTDLDVPSLLARAFAARPDLAGLQAELDAAGKGVSIARASYWPSIGLSASYGSSYTSATEASLMDQFDERKSGSISLSVSVPVFDRLSTRRATERARIQQDDAQLALDDLRQQIALEVRRVVLDREAAMQRLTAAEAQVEAARRALEAVRERYGSGVATVFEVSQSQADFVSASSSLVSARYTLLFQDQLLDYYLGDLDPEAGIGG